LVHPESLKTKQQKFWGKNVLELLFVLRKRTTDEVDGPSKKQKKEEEAEKKKLDEQLKVPFPPLYFLFC